MVVFATMLEMNYGVYFVEAKTTNLAQDLLFTNFVPGASLSCYMRHVCTTKFDLRKLFLFEHSENTAASTFGVTHPDDECLASCSESDTVLP